MHHFFVSAAPPHPPARPDYQLRLLTLHDVGAVHELEVMAGEELKANYRVYTASQLAEILSEGFSIGVFINEYLVGFRLFRRALPATGDVAQMLAHAPWSEQRIGYLPGSFVRPTHRRQGLIQAMTSIALERAREQGIDWVYCTVAPNNQASVAHLEKQGFVIQGSCHLYNNALRHVALLEPQPELTAQRVPVQPRASSQTSALMQPEHPPH